MKIIKDSAELANLLDSNKDLFLIAHDVRIEYQVAKDELRDVYCKDLTLKNDEQKFDFIGRNFIGRDFIGRDFIGWDFNGWDFDGRDFIGRIPPEGTLPVKSPLTRQV